MNKACSNGRWASRFNLTFGLVDMQPDGDLTFDAGALWAAAKHRIPMLAGMDDNRA